MHQQLWMDGTDSWVYDRWSVCWWCWYMYDRLHSWRTMHGRAGSDGRMSIFLRWRPLWHPWVGKLPLMTSVVPCITCVWLLVVSGWLELVTWTTQRGHSSCHVMLFSPGIKHPPIPPNANNIGAWTFTKLIWTEPYKYTPHSVTLESPPYCSSTDAAC